MALGRKPLGKQNGAGRPNCCYFLRYLQENMRKIASHCVTQAWDKNNLGGIKTEEND